MGDLIEITDIQQLERLKGLYRWSDWPKHCISYYCLDNFIRWKKSQNGSIPNLNIYTLDTVSAKMDGLFVIKDRYQLFMGTLTKTKLENLECVLNLLDWSYGFKVSSFLESYLPAILNVIEKKQLRLEYNSFTFMYYMPRVEALQLEVSCPEGFYLTELNAERHAHIINEHWPDPHEGSLFLIKRLINWNANVGICVEDTHELVAWCLRLQGGFLGALYVKEQYKRLGLGTAATSALSHKLAQQGDDIMALASNYNRSCAIFNRLGFTISDHCHWLSTYPTITNYQWPNDS